MNNFASFELGKNAYGNPIYLLIASLSGWFMLYQLATFICERFYLNRILTKIGQNSLIIMSLHFLSFKLVNLIKVIIMNKPMFCIAAFPTYYGEDGLWWILYTIIGIALPMIINKPIINIKNRLIKKP